MTTTNTTKIEKLTQQFIKQQAKVYKHQAKLNQLKEQIELLLVKSHKEKETLTTDNKVITFTRRENYSIPKASIPAIKESMPADTFNSLFTTSYRLRESAYNKLPRKSDCRKAIEEQLTIKHAPLSVRVKEVD